MAYVSKKSTVLYVTQEVTEGLAVNPSAGNQAVSILADGFELNPEKELVERNNLTSSISKALPRTGIKSASGSTSPNAPRHGSAMPRGLSMHTTATPVAALN